MSSNLSYPKHSEPGNKQKGSQNSQNKHYKNTTLMNNKDIFRLFIPIEPLPYNAQCLVQFSSVAQLCLAICDPMDCSMPGFPVHHLLPELAQTHVHQVSETIQPSHPLSSPSSVFPSIRVGTSDKSNRRYMERRGNHHELALYSFHSSGYVHRFRSTCIFS